MKILSAFMCAGLLAAVAPVAQGAIQLVFNAGLGNINCTQAGATNNAATCGVVSSNGVDVTFFGATSNSPGTAANANVLDSTTTVTNNSGAFRTVEFWATAPDFSQPATGGGTPAILFTSNASGTGIIGTSSMTVQSCVDVGNALAPPFCSTAGSFLITNAGLSLIGPGGNASNSSSMVISPLNPLYSLGQHITIGLAAGNTVNFSNSLILTPVPEPTSVALFGGVLLMTGIALRKKFARS